MQTRQSNGNGKRSGGWIAIHVVAWRELENQAGRLWPDEDTRCLWQEFSNPTAVVGGAGRGYQNILYTACVHSVFVPTCSSGKRAHVPLSAGQLRPAWPDSCGEEGPCDGAAAAGVTVRSCAACGCPLPCRSRLRAQQCDPLLPQSLT